MHTCAHFLHFILVTRVEAAAVRTCPQAHSVSMRQWLAQWSSISAMVQPGKSPKQNWHSSGLISTGLSGSPSPSSSSSAADITILTRVLSEGGGTP